MGPSLPVPRRRRRYPWRWRSRPKFHNLPNVLNALRSGRPESPNPTLHNGDVQKETPCIKMSAEDTNDGSRRHFQRSLATTALCGQERRLSKSRISRTNPISQASKPRSTQTFKAGCRNFGAPRELALFGFVSLRDWLRFGSGCSSPAPVMQKIKWCYFRTNLTWEKYGQISNQFTRRTNCILAKRTQ